MTPYYRITGHPEALSSSTQGYWRGVGARTDDDALFAGVRDVRKPLYVLRSGDMFAYATGGESRFGGVASDATGATGAEENPILAHAAPCVPQQLGSPEFCRDHRVRFAYVAGSMANGIASTELVESMARAGMLSFFGAAGLPLAQVERAIETLSRLGDLPYGFNLIHSPGEPALESGAVDLYLAHGIHTVEASAFLDLTPPIVRYRVHGIQRAADGSIETPNRLLAKVSRIEVARKFLAPPPDALLQQLVASGDITAEQRQLARQIPLAEDLTAEADSGGHTDNRPALTLLPTMLALAARQQREYGFAQRLRVGAAGGIATPASALAAFAMGADYILTGTINQACVEAGTSDTVREMLAATEQADVIMAPAADMFEMGVQLQVLKRGTMFAMRAAKLYELYRNHTSLDDIPLAERTRLEQTVFKAPLDEIWQRTREFFLERDPRQVERGEQDARHRMALVFRWYLGLSSAWANSGVADRKIDYQVWCGPAMGAFNEWVRGSFLESPQNRHVVTVALNVLYGAAVLQRVQALRSQGIPVDESVAQTQPLEAETILEIIGNRSPLDQA